MKNLPDSTWIYAPRVTGLSEAFRDIALGNKGQPNLQRVEADLSLFKSDKRKTNFLETFYHYAGFFDHHYVASIPYILEENCRQGVALIEWSKKSLKNNFRCTYIQTIESSEGTFARSVAYLAGDSVKSLSNSATKENFEAFKRNAPNNASFYQGPFYEISKQLLTNNQCLNDFSLGFDFIFEDTAFQMYGPERSTQVEFVIQNLKCNGIFITIEKCFHNSRTEYEFRENQKDTDFKSRYFSHDEIVKKREVLAVMEQGQIYYTVLVDCLNQFFKFGYLIWNSGNFYAIAASNDIKSLKEFVSLLGAPCIPPPFQYHQPHRIF